ncbi:hypothetical protein ACSYAD_11640 [Acaryochloris marina NIES-2412]|uniref:hypothetical protein n=1 Tax=Acaryochloris marina TaxID=155978 RepID=UPI004058BD44
MPANSLWNTSAPGLCRLHTGYTGLNLHHKASGMIDQKNILTTLGCSGSLLLALALPQPASATTNLQDQIEAEQSFPTAAISQSDSIEDATGCGCAICQRAPIETGL